MSINPPANKGCVTPASYRCAYPAPYPEVRVERPNARYAYLLLQDYAGAISELTAVTQYVYHHFVFEDSYPELADLLSCVALVEMHHQEILAETIIKLGVDPRYWTIETSDVPRYWNASFVFYGTSLCDRLTADIAGEWAAIANYRKHAQMIEDRFIRETLERIIQDELHHIMLFNQAAQKYCQLHMPQR